MAKYWLITVLLVLLLCAVLSCSKSTRNEGCNGDAEVPIDFAPKENEEAELAALCLSGELVASDSLYNQILSDLAAIRAAFGDTFEAVVRVKFRPPWVAGCLIIGFDDTTAQQVVSGEYHAWDDLNKYYQITTIRTSLTPAYGAAVLYFHGRLHPYRLGGVYRGLPGVTYTEPNGLIGDSPNIYLRQTGRAITYLFRDAWGDCPSGCIDSEYWYFAVEDGQPVFLDHWGSDRRP
jgi:hypothetical protein